MNYRKFIIAMVFTLPLLLSAQQPAPAIALTDGSTYLMAPKWAPDGNTIAATSTNYKGIYLVTYPNGQVSQISDRPAAGFGMEWSHTGDQIATVVARFEGKRRYNALMSIDAATGAESQLSDFQTLFPGTPEWTRNDQHIYLKGTDHFKLYSVESAQRVQASSADLAVSDIVYTKKGQLRFRNISNGTDQQIDPVQGEILNLTVSPDGTKMAFEIIGGNLWVADIDGSNPVDLGRGNRPAWAPNSEKLTYMITEDNGHEFTAADIFIVNADGSGKVNLTNSQDILEMYPTWSPNGNLIAFSTLSDGKIFIQEAR